MASYMWNGVSGDWNLASDWTPAGGPPTASDSATINGSATDTITVDTADVASSLTLTDANATLDDGGASASLTVGGLLTMSDGTLNISLGSRQDGYDGGSLTVGALNLSGGAMTVNDDGQLNLNGTLSQTGGTLTLDGGTISGGTIDSTAGTLAFTSDGGTLSGVTFDGPLNLTSTSPEGLILANGTTVVGSSGSGPGTINDTGVNSSLFFDNTQTVSNTTINLGNSDDLIEYNTAGAQVLTLASSVTVDVQGSAYIEGIHSSDGIVNQGAIDQTGSAGELTIFNADFTNSGTIDAEATDGALFIDPTAFTNDGAIDVANGELVRIYTAVTGTGTDTISGHSTLEFEAGVSSAKTLGDQDIDFNGAGTLHLLKPASFYGEISDFATGDAIKLKGSWAFSAISEAGGVTTLTLARGSSTHAFEFAGDYAQSDFSITPGTPTTTIKYS
jgi:hypothetical protein